MVWMECVPPRSHSYPDSLTASESRGLIGHMPWNRRFDWLSGRVPPCQLRERVRLHACDGCDCHGGSNYPWKQLCVFITWCLPPLLFFLFFFLRLNLLWHRLSRKLRFHHIRLWTVEVRGSASIESVTSKRITMHHLSIERAALFSMADLLVRV